MAFFVCVFVLKNNDMFTKFPIFEGCLMNDALKSRGKRDVLFTTISIRRIEFKEIYFIAFTLISLSQRT